MSDELNFEEKDEKEVIKHDEKVEGSDRLSSITWAFILIWAGLVFLANNMNWFPRIGLEVDPSWYFHSFEDWQHFGVWNLIALGAGVFLVLETLVRILIPQFRRNVGGSLIVAAVFIGVGLGGWFSWNYLWPVILIAVGLNILLKGFFRRGGGREK